MTQVPAGQSWLQGCAVFFGSLHFKYKLISMPLHFRSYVFDLIYKFYLLSPQKWAIYLVCHSTVKYFSVEKDIHALAHKLTDT